jgi:hypothetical protein
LQVNDSFESLRGKDAVLRAKLFHENRPKLIAITEETAAGGKRSLKVTDAPDLQYAFNPHFYYVPGHREGTTRCTFDLRVEAGSQVHHEWRDDSQPYRIGPTLFVRDGHLLIGREHREVLKLPLGQWVHFEITAALGAKSTGKWDLSVTLPGAKPQVFRDLANASKEWKKLDWLGFCAQGKSNAVFYLDNIDLKNAP